MSAKARSIVGGMTTIVVDGPALADDIEQLDFEPLTAVYIAPQACEGRGGPCLYTSNCCRGLECYGSDPAKYIFGNCVT